MATVTITDFRVERDLGNAELTLEYDIVFDAFDIATNLGYTESWGFFEDDTGFDGDLDAPDDRIGARVVRRGAVHADGRTSISRIRTRRMEWDDLNLDHDTWGGDEELRGEVKLEPRLPSTVEVESDVVLVDASR